MTVQQQRKSLVVLPYRPSAVVEAQDRLAFRRSWIHGFPGVSEATVRAIRGRWLTEQSSLRTAAPDLHEHPRPLRTSPVTSDFKVDNAHWADPVTGKAEWNSYLGGQYRCLHSVTPACIEGKAHLTTVILTATTESNTGSAQRSERLHSLIDELDTLDAAFTACDRLRFGGPIFRDLHRRPARPLPEPLARGRGRGNTPRPSATARAACSPIDLALASLIKPTAITPHIVAASITAGSATVAAAWSP